MTKVLKRLTPGLLVWIKRSKLSKIDVQKHQPTSFTDLQEETLERSQLDTTYHPELEWILAKVISLNDTHVQVEIIEDSSRIDLCLVSENFLPADSAVYENMTEMYHTHKPGIIFNLMERALSRSAYTYIGSVLVTINPLRDADSHLHFYPEDSANWPPHPKTVAERAYQRMILNVNTSVLVSNDAQQRQLGPISQSVVISGESGSGKTETAKRVLGHLVDREDELNEGLEEDCDKEYVAFQKCLLAIDPILESFGNAETVSNPNSSRFGRFLRVWYSPFEDSDGDRSNVSVDEDEDTLYISNASISTYLLEVSRVIHQNDGEGCFRIFRQLLTGGSKELHKYLGFIEAGFLFRYLNNYSTSISQDQEGLDQLQGGIRAFKGIFEEISLFEVAAALLHLGNIDFEEDYSTGGCYVAAGTFPYSPVLWVCKLLQVKRNVLVRLLTTTPISIPGEDDTILQRLPVQLAKCRRDAISKFIYNLFFHYIVTEINSVLKGNFHCSKEKPFIGILDISGFENFEHNTFEQLLMNYVNEVLLSLFVREILIDEANIYKNEGLLLEKEEMSRVSNKTKDYNDILHLFEGYKVNKRYTPGILYLIDQQQKVPFPEDSKILKSFRKHFKRNVNFLEAHPSKRSNNFIIKHYASNVTYCIDGFLLKNDQKLPSGMKHLFESSKQEIFNKLSWQDFTNSTMSRVIPLNRHSKPLTVCSIFVEQLLTLKNILKTTSCCYIRCIKPNRNLSKPPPVLNEGEKRCNEYNTQANQYFDKHLVSQQLNNLGVYDCISVLKEGLPTRISYSTFLNVYSKVIDMNKFIFYKKRSNDFKSKMFVVALMDSYKIDSNIYKLGKSKIFFKNEKVEVLQDVLFSKISTHTKNPRFYSHFDSFHCTFLWKRFVSKTVALFYFLKDWRIIHSTLLLQRRIRTFLAYQKVLKYNSSVVIQNFWYQMRLKLSWKSDVVFRKYPCFKFPKTIEKCFHCLHKARTWRCSRLWISGLNVSLEESKTFETCLSQNSTLTHFVLIKSNVEGNGINNIILGLMSTSNLYQLNLSFMGIKDRSIRLIASLIRRNNTISILNLDNNEITNKGATLVADSLKKNHTISCLTLSNNRLTKQVVKSFVLALKNNRIISELQLNINVAEDKIIDRCLAKNRNYRSNVFHHVLSSNRLSIKPFSVSRICVVGEKNCGKSLLIQALISNEPLDPAKFRSSFVGGVKPDIRIRNFRIHTKREYWEEVETHSNFTIEHAMRTTYSMIISDDKNELEKYSNQRQSRFVRRKRDNFLEKVKVDFENEDEGYFRAQNLKYHRDLSSIIKSNQSKVCQMKDKEVYRDDLFQKFKSEAETLELSFYEMSDNKVDDSIYTNLYSNLLPIRDYGIIMICFDLSRLVPQPNSESPGRRSLIYYLNFCRKSECRLFLVGTKIDQLKNPVLKLKVINDEIRKILKKANVSRLLTNSNSNLLFSIFNPVDQQSIKRLRSRIVGVCTKKLETNNFFKLNELRFFDLVTQERCLPGSLIKATLSTKEVASWSKGLRLKGSSLLALLKVLEKYGLIFCLLDAVGASEKIVSEPKSFLKALSSLFDINSCQNDFDVLELLSFGPSLSQIKESLQKTVDLNLLLHFLKESSLISERCENPNLVSTSFWMFPLLKKHRNTLQVKDSDDTGDELKQDLKSCEILFKVSQKRLFLSSFFLSLLCYLASFWTTVKDKLLNSGSRMKIEILNQGEYPVVRFTFTTDLKFEIAQDKVGIRVVVPQESLTGTFATYNIVRNSVAAIKKMYPVVYAPLKTFLSMGDKNECLKSLHQANSNFVDIFNNFTQAENIKVGNSLNSLERYIVHYYSTEQSSLL